MVFWRATPKRIERFVEVCQQKEVPYTKALVQDCKTRWNSTFLMLDVALLYEDVFERLSWLEPSFKCCPSSEEWKLARIICSKLSLFYEVTLLFSGNKYPTSNLYFPKVCQIRLALTEWAFEEDEDIKNMAEKMLEKFDKYWSVIHGIMAVATILDPRYKMKVVECYYSLIYPDSAYDEIEKVRRVCYELFREYEEKLRRIERNKSTSCGLTTSSHTSYGGSASLDSIEADIYEKWLANHGATNSSQKNELDYYLEEAVMPRMENFDVLSWWKTNTKFPILQDMARDILAIPISIVSLESSFSTSSQFITPHRNWLHPKTLEALMCS